MLLPSRLFPESLSFIDFLSPGPTLCNVCDIATFRCASPLYGSGHISPNPMLALSRSRLLMKQPQEGRGRGALNSDIATMAFWRRAICDREPASLRVHQASSPDSEAQDLVVKEP